MPRYKLTIEYDGAPYQGWQWQDHGPSVQGVLEAAGAKLNKGEPVVVYGSGRTDSGVHALAQIAHMDLAAEIREDKLRDAMNFHMVKHAVTVLKAEIMPDEWHARFDATEREYLYRLIDRRMKLSLDRGRVWRIPVKLDADAMHDAAQIMIGKHDFSTFRDTQCQAKSPIKTLDEITVLRAGAEVHCHFRARSFLHKQVRSIVGSLVEVGMGKWDAEDMQAALEARDRTQCGPVAPPDGLYLTKVSY
ncbi:tRNA pseudouridine(38-40) synthase TruA [Litorimonas sp. RW-G-Af-16]|uniref:tRNA pseudouridine(38-40) synthase TruA n=1 Tax=Litorimonas sp. RW-G-Af-16 TaxID=3241168 RepID=UPI00390CCBE4